MDDEDIFRELMFPNKQAAAKVPELARIYEFVGLGQLSGSQSPSWPSSSPAVDLA